MYKISGFFTFTAKTGYLSLAMKKKADENETLYITVEQMIEAHLPI